MIRTKDQEKVYPGYASKLQEIKGLLCIHPIHFLGDEPPTVREKFMAIDLFQ